MSVLLELFWNWSYFVPFTDSDFFFCPILTMHWNPMFYCYFLQNFCNVVAFSTEQRNFLSDLWFSFTHQNCFLINQRFFWTNQKYFLTDQRYYMTDKRYFKTDQRNFLLTKGISWLTKDISWLTKCISWLTKCFLD